MAHLIVEKEFDWAKELEKTVVNSLVTTFGLDFLLAEDKRGGDVDTIHKAREWQREQPEINQKESELNRRLMAHYLHSGDYLANQKKTTQDLKKLKESTIHISDELKSQFDTNGKNNDPYKKSILDENGNPRLNSKGKEIKQDEYHNQSDLYNARKKADKLKEDLGIMTDGYTGEKIDKNDFKRSKNSTYVTELDHVIPTSEIHNDAGRILSGLGGDGLANHASNLVSTHGYINNIKNNHSNHDFLKKGGIRDQKVKELSETISQGEMLISTIDSMMNIAENIEQGNIDWQKSLLERDPDAKIDIDSNFDSEWDSKKEEFEALKKELEEYKRKKELLESLDEEKIMKIEAEAREEYNRKINYAYYKSAKFVKATAFDMHKKGFAMGTRQVLGMIFAEVWFELREQIPEIYQNHRQSFKFQDFLMEMQETVRNIWQRIQTRFKDLFTTFRDSYIGGALASLNTTLLNTFLITEKMIGKMIREIWNSLVGIFKLVFFNPNNLLMGDLLKEALRLLSIGVSTLVGTYVHTALSSLLQFPLGAEISAFISALVTGILNLGFVYFLEHSELAQKVWTFLNKFTTDIEYKINHMKQINAELDRFLTELTKLEFNLNPEELTIFANALEATNSELERNWVLRQEISRRNIDLPYEAGNTESVRNFLRSKLKK